MVGGGVATLSAEEYAGSDSGAVRSYRFWKGVVPIYAHYKYIEWTLKNEADPVVISATYRPLNERYSPRIQELVLNLKGFYYKLAQIMSTRDDFLPEEYSKWTKDLQDKSPAIMDSAAVRAIVEEQLEVKMDEYFERWDDTPIGAASVGQVHRARLAETHEEVAVKVQYPGIERKFRNDIDTVEMFCKYLMPQNTAYFAEIKRQFATEFDMRGEAKNLKEVHDNLHRGGWQQLVEVPQPRKASKLVLVMSYLPGCKLVDGIRAQFATMAAHNGQTLEELEAEQKRLIEEGGVERQEIRTVVNATRRVRWLLALRDNAANVVVALWNYSLLGLVKRDWRMEYWKSEGPVNLGEVMDTLIRVHGHEIFTDGAFNGDPHPGNVLLMDDGRLGLVDYGQVKRMRLEDRVTFAKLVIALSRDEREEVVRLMVEEVGFRTKGMDEDIIYRTAAFFHCRDSEDILQGMNVSEFMEWLEESDPVERINDEFVMVGRVSLLLRGLANAFAMKVRMSDYWKEQAAQFLKEQGIEY